LYELTVRAALPVLHVAAPFNARLRRGIAGRRASASAMRAFAHESRDLNRRLIWLHAPSVGEALMAQAILAALKQRDPTLQFAFTYFSPSAERMAARVGADWHGFLPWDHARAVHAAIDALRPACIAFVRTEIWPVLVREAVARSVGVMMVNGVLAPGSSRLGRAARLLLGPSYARLNAVGAVSAEDAVRFATLGVPPHRVRVTGDARFDQVQQRIAAQHANATPLLEPFRAQPGPWLVAGSTWPADEDLLIAALAERRGAWRAILTPHEPSAAHLARLEKALDRAGLRHVRLPTIAGASFDETSDVVVVDRVGVLADLYGVADAAYVGGGFGSAGLHSVVEPAALGVPVLYGPRHGNAREAEWLAAAGGGFIVTDPRTLADRLRVLREDDGGRATAAEAARAFVVSRTGAADANARLIEEVLRETVRAVSR
jgi:3-deoxy-D-manno-octulosonic-acid transferase